MQTLVAMGAGMAASADGSSPAAKVGAGSAWLMALLFWALWRWSKSAPLPPTLAALVIYVTMGWATLAYEFAVVERLLGEDAALRYTRPNALSLLKLVIVVLLGRALYAGVKHRRLVEAASEAGATAAVSASGDSLKLPMAVPPAEPRRIAGVCSSLALYLALLYSICNITALWGSNELTPAVFAQLVEVNAVLVGVWSVACWRDVLRPLLHPVHPGWYLAAAPIGCATFAVAFCWLWAVRTWAGFPTDAPAPSTGEAEVYGWGMQLLLTAVSPAVVEELAFRGIIFGALRRTLGGWETVIVTALMFMVLHVSVASFPHLFVGGLLLGAIRLRTGSWLPGVFIHFTHNFLALVVAGS